jgi:hypothetical protein
MRTVHVIYFRLFRFGQNCASSLSDRNIILRKVLKQFSYLARNVVSVSIEYAFTSVGSIVLFRTILA